jgi:CspA family cold shock protein
MPTGIVKLWNVERGFGFISRDDGAGDIFAHIRDVRGQPEALEKGARVAFEEGINSRNGKPQAEKVAVL